MKANKVMVDLETLSSKSNAGIISIGAVLFSDTEVTDQFFYATIDPQDSETAGLHISASTFVWWMQQSEGARAQFSAKGAPLAATLEQFSDWCKLHGVKEMWGNGSDFDCVILGNAYDACGLKKPWSYSGNRCFRTLKSLVSAEVANMLWAEHNKGTQHNALDDAIRQANIAVEIFKMRR